MHKFDFSRVKQTALTLFATFLVMISFAQGNAGNPPGGDPPGGGNGRGGRSNDHVPKGQGMIKSADNASTTMLSPTGWGSTESFAFVSASGTTSQLYGTEPDLGLRTGVGVGDSRKTLSLVGIVNVYDMSALSKFQIRDVTYSLIASRSLGRLGSISVGSLNSFADTSVADGVHSFYAAYSWAAKGLRSVTPGNPRLSFTIGAGTGNFYLKSPADVKADKGRYGTAVFGSVSYDVVKNLSVNAEWTGLNLGLTSSYTLPHNIATVYAGVAELTRYSGDKPTFVFGIGRAFGLKK